MYLYIDTRLGIHPLSSSLPFTVVFSLVAGQPHYRPRAIQYERDHTRH